jgi:hypothetical protein
LERDTPRFSKVTWLVFVSRGLAVGASSVVAGAVTGTPGEFELGLKIGLIAGTLSGVMAALGPLVEWWGGQSFSAAARGVWDILLLAGFCLQSVQYILPLFNVAIR